MRWGLSNMTPNEMDKLLTDLMAEDMNSVGLRKRKRFF